MIHLRVDLGVLETLPTDRIPGFTERLMATLPGLADHGCSLGRPGGFAERMTSGTWMGHVVEHVALELQRAAGGTSTRGKTRAAGPSGIYDVIVAYEDEAVGRAAVTAAVELVNTLIQRDRPAADAAEATVTSLRALAARGRLGLSTQAIIDAAERRYIPWTRLDGANLIQLGWGVHTRRIRATVTSRTTLIGAEIARDKDQAAAVLERAGLPTPRWRLATSDTQAIAQARALGYPVVVKPVDGHHGRGVTLDVAGDDGAAAAFQRAVASSRRGQAIVQEQVTGRDHRLLVVGGRLVACAERVPATVVGDGRSTVAQLVDRENEDPRRGHGHARALSPDHARRRSPGGPDRPGTDRG